jgi:hypothetical protein
MRVTHTQMVEEPARVRRLIRNAHGRRSVRAARKPTSLVYDQLILAGQRRLGQQWRECIRHMASAN